MKRRRRRNEEKIDKARKGEIIYGGRRKRKIRNGKDGEGEGNEGWGGKESYGRERRDKDGKGRRRIGESRMV